MHEAEDGTTSSLTFAELADRVARVRAGLRALGIGRGDAVALYVPMTADAVVAVYAVASVGAMLVPLFSGFAPGAIASRIQDAGARAVVSADGTIRRGRPTPMLAPLREALKSCPTVETVAVIDNIGRRGDLAAGEVAWEELLGAVSRIRSRGAHGASDVLLLAYTSGTTGRPKGAVHTHAGFVTKTASEVAYGFEMGPGRTLLLDHRHGLDHGAAVDPGHPRHRRRR